MLPAISDFLHEGHIRRSDKIIYLKKEALRFLYDCNESSYEIRQKEKYCQKEKGLLIYVKKNQYIRVLYWGMGICISQP